VKDEAQAQPSTDAVKQRAKVLIEELTALAETATGTTNAYDVSVGTTFAEPSPGCRERQLPGRLGEYRLEFADHKRSTT
jgi:hypothetical protein